MKRRPRNPVAVIEPSDGCEFGRGEIGARRSDRDIGTLVDAALMSLDDTSRWVVMRSFGLSAAPRKDLDEIASELELTEAHVEAIQLKAFRLLRSPSKLSGAARTLVQ